MKRKQNLPIEQAETVRLYFADVTPLRDPDLYARAMSLASEERKAKTKRFRMRPDRIRSLAAELLLRKALSDAGHGTEALRYEYGPQGKPFLAGAPDFQFSISHSGDYVLVAAAGRNVGCDIEKIENADLKIAERFFSEEEKAMLRAIPENARNDAFYRLWTMKESYIKATGDGLSLPLSAFTVRCSEDGRAEVIRDGKTEAYGVSSWDGILNYAAAVAVEGGSPVIKAEKADISRLLIDREAYDDHRTE